MKKMTVREKILLGILIVLILFCGYYFFFLEPVSNQIDYCISENLAVEDQILVADATAEKKKMMEAELEAIFSGEMGNVKELPAYDNSHNVMNQLSAIMAGTTQYDISFASVEEEDSTIRRSVTISYECPTYEEARNILTRIANSDYRCIYKDLYINSNEYKDVVSYNVVADIVFFEYN